MTEKETIIFFMRRYVVPHPFSSNTFGRNKFLERIKHEYGVLLPFSCPLPLWGRVRVGVLSLTPPVRLGLSQRERGRRAGIQSNF
jgi:hypothetical protein